MQVMGQVARESGFDGSFLSSLCDPDNGLAVGCKVLRHDLLRAHGVLETALLEWNGGKNTTYATQVLARMVRYK
jgi:hypothetical protein